MKAAPAYYERKPVDPVTVRVSEGSILYRCGRVYKGGDQLETAADDARRLKLNGTVEYV